MPDQSAHAVAIRAPSHSVRVHGSFYVGEVVASGTVNLVPSSPRFVLGVAYSVGSYLDVRIGMEVVILTSTGDFKGRTCIPDSSVPIVSNVLPIRELSLGTIDVQAGDLFQVLNEYRVHDRLVAALPTFDPSYLIYSDEGSNPPPVACSGNPYAAYVDGYYTQATPATFATVQMTGSTSYVTDPDSGGSLTHLWTLPSGVAFQSGSTNSDPDPMLEVNQGSYIIVHDVTDDDNGKTTTQYVPIMIHDDAHQPYELMLDNGIQTDEQYGWRATARVFQDATLTDIPDGSLVMLWTDERINGAWQSFGNITPGRENMLVVGYTQSDNSTAEAAIKKTYFDIISPLQRLDLIAGYSKVMEQSASPDAWSKLKSLSVFRAMVQLIFFYTTYIPSGFDLIFDPDFLNKLYPALYLQRSTPLQQIRELANGVDARLCCDPTGRIDIYTHPAYIPLADRAAVTVTFTLAKQDIIDFSFTRSHYNQVELMKTSGFTAGYTGNNPIFSLYPGSAPGEATNAPTRDRLICDDQDDLNDRTGRYGALNDNVFIDSDGSWQRGFELKLNLFGSYNFFRLYHEYVQFDIAGSSNLRGIDLSGFRFWVKSVQVTYTGGTARVALVLQTETNAPTGTTYYPPTPSQTTFPPITSPTPPPITQPTIPSWMLASGTTKRALVCDNGLALCNNWNARGAQGGPTWGFYSWASLSVSGTVLDWCPDGNSSPPAGWLITSTKAYYLVLSTQTATHKADFAHTSLHRSIDAAFAIGRTHMAVSSYINGVGVDVMFTTDNSSFPESTVDTHHPSDDTSFGIFTGCFASTRSDGLVYISVYTNNGSIFAGTATSKGLYSTDHGATFPNTLAMTSSDLLAQEIAVPWQGTDSTYYYGAFEGAAGLDVGHLYRNAVNITPTIGGEHLIPRSPRDAIAISVMNGQRVMAVLQRNLSSDYALVLTNNSTASAPGWSVLDAPGSDFRRCVIYGDTPNIGAAFGVNNAVSEVTINGNSATFDSKTGNLAALSVGEILAIAGWSA